MLILPVNSIVEGWKLGWQLICLLSYITDILKGNLIEPITLLETREWCLGRVMVGIMESLRALGRKARNDTPN